MYASVVPKSVPECETTLTDIAFPALSLSAFTHQIVPHLPLVIRCAKIMTELQLLRHIIALLDTLVAMPGRTGSYGRETIAH